MVESASFLSLVMRRYFDRGGGRGGCRGTLCGLSQIARDILKGLGKFNFVDFISLLYSYCWTQNFTDLPIYPPFPLSLISPVCNSSPVNEMAAVAAPVRENAVNDKNRRRNSTTSPYLPRKQSPLLEKVEPPEKEDPLLHYPKPLAVSEAEIAPGAEESAVA